MDSDQKAVEPDGFQLHLTEDVKAEEEAYRIVHRNGYEGTERGGKPTPYSASPTPEEAAPEWGQEIELGVKT